MNRKIGQPFKQHEQNKQQLQMYFSPQIIEHEKTMSYDVGNLCPGTDTKMWQG